MLQLLAPSEPRPSEEAAPEASPVDALLRKYAAQQSALTAVDISNASHYMVPEPGESPSKNLVTPRQREAFAAILVARPGARVLLPPLEREVTPLRAALETAMGNTVFIPASHSPRPPELGEDLVPGLQPRTRQEPFIPEEIAFGAV